MNRPNTNRPGAGKTTPIPCPDCGVHAALTDARFLMTGKPCIPHAPTCPTHRAVTEQLCADLDWLEDHPGEKTRTRPLVSAEFVEMAIALGRRVPRSQRHRWCLSTMPFTTGRHRCVSRAYAFDGSIVAVSLLVLDQAGAT